MSRTSRTIAAGIVAATTALTLATTPAQAATPVHHSAPADCRTTGKHVCAVTLGGVLYKITFDSDAEPARIAFGPYQGPRGWAIQP